MPYNPGITYKGADYFFNAISGAGKDIAEGIRRYSDERKKDKAVDAAFGAMEPWLTKATEQGYLEPGILAKYAAAARGTADQKQGIMQGLGQVLTFANKVQDMSLAQAQEKRAQDMAQYAGSQDSRAAALAAAQLKQYGDVAAQRERGVKFAESVAQPDVTEVPGVSPYPTPRGLNLGPWAGGQPVRVQRPLNEDTVMRKAAQTGALTPDMAVDLLKSKAAGERSAAWQRLTEEQIQAKIRTANRVKTLGEKDLMAELTRVNKGLDNVYADPANRSIWEEERATILERLAEVRGAASPAAAGKVKVMSPDGTTGYVPAANLERALQQGYTRVE